MIMYSRELTVAWGESDPFGLVYYPMMFTWFNETEHELLRGLGFGTKELIETNRTAFVMGDVHFRFIGPAAYGDRVRTTMKLVKLGGSTVHWDCKAVHSGDGAAITEGRLTGPDVSGRRTAAGDRRRPPQVEPFGGRLHPGEPLCRVRVAHDEHQRRAFGAT